MKKKKKTYRLPEKRLLSAQEKISRYMRGNKSRDTRPEMLLRRALWQAGLRGYRVHWPQAPGKPDICYPGRGLAIFVHGCFWHCCPHCLPSFPKSNERFWAEKFRRNQERDAAYGERYRQAGWQRVVVWECQLRDDLAGCLMVIRGLHEGVPESTRAAS